MGGKQNTAGVCEALALPVAQELGLIIWDVEFEKEGAGWYLRYLIDREGETLTIDDCENFSRRMSELLDAHDPIEQSYTLEVSSPGIERKLTREWHFAQYADADVLARLIRPENGEREFIGKLDSRGADGTVVIELENGEKKSFAPSDTAYIRLYAKF